MISRRSLLKAFALAPWLPRLAAATSNHTFEPNEYDPIDRATSPDGRLTIVAHGEGELGIDNFNLYLAHANGARIGPLFTDDTPVLDTDPATFHAVWAPDSRHFGVYYRPDRHVVDTLIYAVGEAGATAVSGPSLMQAAVGRSEDALAERQIGASRTLTWIDGGRFKLMETRLFKAEAGLAKAFKGYGRKEDALTDKLFVVAFSAEADCTLGAGTAYTIGKIRTGDFKV